MIKRCLTSLVATLIVCFLACSSASARVCFLPDSTDCGEGDVVGGGDVIIPCQYKKAEDVPLNSAYQEPYKSGMCYYARCKISQSTCESNNGKNKKCCKFDSASGCYYMGDCPPEECPADYTYSAEQAADRKSLMNCSCSPCSTDATKWKCTCPQECSKIEPVNTYTNECDAGQIPHIAEGVIGSNGQCYTCEDKPLEIVKPVITITYKETYNSLTPGPGADSEEYYYITLKFTATSSDNISRTILMKTYPAMTCSKPQYTTGSPVTINEGTETIIGSRCGTQSRPLLVSSVAALDTFINGTKVYSFKPYSSRTLYDDLDGTTVETNDYTVKFVKEGKCLYAYRKVTVSDSDGVTGDLDESKKCTNTTTCWRNLKKITSLYTYTGTPIVHPISRISNRSATCVDDNGVTKYETICEGNPEYHCLQLKKKFIPNGCVSDAYHHGLIINGDKWGTCGCDTDKGAYDTIEECRSGTNSGCGKSDTESCYRTCEAQGYYSTKEECEKTVDKVACEKVSDTSDCYRKEIKGFFIRYAKDEKRTWRCSDGGANSRTTETHAWLAEILPNNGVGARLKTVEGIQYQDLPDNVRDATETYQYPAGTYYLCADFEDKGSTGIMGYLVSLNQVKILYAKDLVGSDPTQTKCFTKDISSNSTCSKVTSTGNDDYCYKFTFEKGKLYLIKFDYYCSSCNFNRDLCINGF